MTPKEYELLTKVKEYIFEPKRRLLCDNRWWCGYADGYCPTYDCGALDKLKQYTDRQWLNVIREVLNLYGNNICFEDFISEVLYEMRYKKPSRYRK